MTDADLYPDLSFATLDAGKDGEPVDERVAGWNQAVTRGFHQGRASEELAAVWSEHARTDAVILRGAWVNEPRVGPGTIPVATYSSFDKTLNAGLEPLPARMITDVTVAPSHRRRGLLRRMITDDLEDAVRHGVPVAVLTVSEGSIYGRFGFGAATHLRTIEVDTTSRFALRAPLGEEPDPGRVEMLEPEEAWPVVTDLFDRFHRSTRGSVERPHFYRSMLTGTFSLEQGGPDHQLRACVHVDGSDHPDGYVLYRHAGRSETPRTIDVVDLVAQSPTAYRQLWRFLADIDLVQRVRWHRAPTTDPLEWALVEPHVVKVTGVGDLLWVRVLDVPAALRARPWSADGSVVLEVDDPLGHAGGRWLVRTEDGRAEVTATDAAAGVRMAADTLGSLYLGGVAVTALRDGGRLAGSAEAVATLAAMADGGPAPYCITAF